MDNRLSQETWIVVVSPKTGKRLAVPCSGNRSKIAVVLKAQKAIGGFGDTDVELTGRELQQFFGSWRAYKNAANKIVETPVDYPPDG